MQELLMVQNKVIPPETGDVLFLYDPATNSDLSGRGATSVLSGGTILDPTVLINGQRTLRFPSDTATHTINFPTDINLMTTNWTWEWCFRNEAIPGNNVYANDLVAYSRGISVGLYTRWYDQGFGNRFTLADSRGLTNSAFVQLVPLTKALAFQVDTNIALVCISGLIKVYINGIAQPMTLGNTSTYNQTTFPATSMDKIYQLVMGWAASSVPGIPSYRGRMRLSNFVRYRGNYTPGPLNL